MNNRAVATFVRWNLSASQCQKFCEALYEVSEILGYRKVLGIMLWHHDFPSKFYSLRVPQNFVGEPFCVSEKFWFGKGIRKKGEHHDFLTTIFCLTYQKKLVGEQFCVSQKVWYEKNMSKRGGGVGVTVLRRKFFVSQCRKSLWGTIKCFKNFGVWKSFMHYRGCHDFSSKVFSLILLKNFVGDPSLSEKKSGFEKDFIEGDITLFNRGD